MDYQARGRGTSIFAAFLNLFLLIFVATPSQNFFVLSLSLCLCFLFVFVILVSGRLVRF